MSESKHIKNTLRKIIKTVCSISMPDSIVKYKINSKESFKNAMKMAEIAVKRSKTKEDKLYYLNYMIETIKTDIQTDGLANVIYRNEELNIPENQGWFVPFYYTDLKGNPQKTEIIYDDKIVDDIKDFRVAIIFEITKIKLTIEEGK